MELSAQVVAALVEMAGQWMLADQQLLLAAEGGMAESDKISVDRFAQRLTLLVGAVSDIKLR